LQDIGLIRTQRVGYRRFRRKFIAEGTDFWSAEEQHEACIALMRKNKHYMRNHYSYIGRTIAGVKITEAGILSACHLVGHRAVKDFLESNGSVVAKDGFNTSLIEYMQLMEGVSVDI
jgi:hypothetical protein